jgi:oxygen-independent coproporphyrinogen-3 oxidase
LTRDGAIRRHVIQSLRSFFAVKFSAVNDRYGMEFHRYFQKELEYLQEFARDGIVEIGQDQIIITELGHQFANIVCRVFDRYYEGEKLSSDMGERTDDQTPVPSAVEPLKNRRAG